MWGNHPDIRAALQALGVSPTASLAEAKSAFRQHAKALHPDKTPPKPETLKQLSDMVAAIRLLEYNAPCEIDIQISDVEATSGTRITRTLKNKTMIFVIPPETSNDDRVSAAGQPHIIARITIRSEAKKVDHNAAPDQLDRFVSEFVDRSASSRLANWLRKARSAA